MGSWNATCALTRMPIEEKAKVKLLRSFNLKYFERNSGNTDMPLVLGLPVDAVYKDCDFYDFDEKSKLVKDAIEKSERENPFIRNSGCQMDGQDIFLPINGDMIADVIKWDLKAKGFTDDRISEIARRIAKDAEDICQRRALTGENIRISAVLEDVVDSIEAAEPYSDSIIRIMQRANLWPITASWLPIHAVAYDALSEAAAAAPVYTFENKETIGELMKNSYQEWLARMEKYSVDLEPEEKDDHMFWMPASNIDSLNRPWGMISKSPGSSHFWDTMHPLEAMKLVPMEEWMKFFSFQAGLQRSRFLLAHGSPGSQNTEYGLIHAAVSSVFEHFSAKPTVEPLAKMARLPG